MLIGVKRLRALAQIKVAQLKVTQIKVTRQGRNVLSYRTELKSITINISDCACVILYISKYLIYESFIVMSWLQK
jgi:hypothetical protein